MSKPRMCEVWRKDELDALLPYQGDLNVPTLVPSKEFGVYHADADELRAWREKRASQHQSEARRGELPRFAK